MKISIIVSLVLFMSYYSVGQNFVNTSGANGFNYGYGTGLYAGGASFVDFDGDGDDDITVVSSIDENIHFHENIDGEFIEITAPISNFDQTKQVIWVDYDNDGDMDLYVGSSQSNKLYKNYGDLFLSDISETCGFNDPDVYSFSTVWFDFDEDGLLDLCTSHRNGLLDGSITLYKNLGEDQFTDVTEEAGLSNQGVSVLAMVAFDFNNDGLEDLYVGQDFDAGNLLFKNLGNGTFEDVSQSSGTNISNDTMTASVGDYNNDGWMDLYVTHTNEPQFFINNGDETFSELSMELGVGQDEFSFGVVFLDADNDMDLDLYRNGIINSFMFENTENEIPFQDVSESWGITGSNAHCEGNAIGDFDNDGALDIFKLVDGNNHELWHNQFSENSFLKVKLIGQVSNRNAVGAVLQLEAGGITQHRRIGCGEGFCSQNTFTQHFGLGSNESAQALTIIWPSGITQTFNDIAANQELEITEPFSGCTDPMACNYLFGALEDDGSCTYALPFLDCEGNCLQDSDEDGVCDGLETFGCQDIQACNFDSEATENDPETCEYPLEFLDCEGECLNDTDEDGVCDELEISGCTDIEACNYNEDATDEDDSCEYLEQFEITGEPTPWLINTFAYSYNENPESSFSWQVENGTILSGQGSNEVNITWTSVGSGSLSVTETNGDGCQGNEVVLDVMITASSIQERESFFPKVYPNPSSGIIHIDFSGLDFSVEVFDSMGRQVLSEKNQSQVNLTDQSKGVYQVLISTNESTFYNRIMLY